MVAVEVDVKVEDKELVESFEGGCEGRRSVESRLLLMSLLLLSDAALSWNDGEQKKDDLCGLVVVVAVVLRVSLVLVAKGGKGGNPWAPMNGCW
jgi:hypothetical protein